MGLLRSPDGTIVNLPDDQVGSATANGYTPVSLGEAAQSTSSPAPVDNGIAGAIGAGATALLSGATLGASDWALRGLLNKEQFSQLAGDREQHETISGLGQGAGAILPAIVSGGAATPAGALAKYAATGIEAGAAQGGAAGAARALVASGAEGALQNAGAYISDVALGDRDLTAEGMTGALGAGFAFGAGAAGVAHGVQAGTIAARRMFARIADGGEQAAADAAQEWARKSAETLDAADQAATIAEAKLEQARAAREQAAASRDQAVAGVADARAAAPDIDAAYARQAGLESKLSALDEQQIAEADARRAAEVEARTNGGPEDLMAKIRGMAASGPEAELSAAVDEYRAARSEFDQIKSRVEAPDDLERSLQSLEPGAVQASTHDADLERSLGQLDVPGVQRDTVPVGEFGAPGKGAIKTPDELEQAAAAAGEPDSTRLLRPARSLGDIASTPDVTNAGGRPRAAAPAPLSPQEFDSLAQIHEGKWGPRTTVDLHGYSGGDNGGRFLGLNRQLRDAAGAPGAYADSVESIDRALARTTIPRDTQLYRGVPGGHFVDEVLAKLEPGQTFVDHGYTSTSAERRLADLSSGTSGAAPRAAITIDVPAGTHAGVIPSSLRDTEREVLLPRGSRFRVVGKQIADDGRVLLHLELQPGKAPGGERFSPIDRLAGGGQGGRWFRDEVGHDWFGKQYGGDADRVRGEHLANEIYRIFGVDVPETKIVEHEGKPTLMSREVRGRAPASIGEVAASNAKDRFVVDAWLGNRDVLGASGDNIILDQGGRAHRVDNGGATIWRASGERKSFGGAVDELSSMRDPKHEAAAVFGKLSDAEVQRQAEDFARTYKARKDEVLAALDRSHIEEATKEQIRQGLEKRAQAIIAMADRTGPASTAAAKPSAEIETSLRSIRRILGDIGAAPENIGLPGAGAIAKLSSDEVAQLALDTAQAVRANKAAILEAFDKLKINPAQRTALRAALEKRLDELVEKADAFSARGDHTAPSGLERLAQLMRDAGEGVERAKPLPRATIPAGWSTSAVSDGSKLFDGEPAVKRGIPNRRQVTRNNYRKLAFVVRPSELADRGVFGLNMDAGATAERVARVHDAWLHDVDMPALEIDIDKRGHLFIASGNKRALAAAQSGDRPMLVRFRPVAADVSKMDRFAPEIRDAISSGTRVPTKVTRLSDLLAQVQALPKLESSVPEPVDTRLLSKAQRKKFEAARAAEQAANRNRIRLSLTADDLSKLAEDLRAKPGEPPLESPPAPEATTAPAPPPAVEAESNARLHDLVEEVVSDAKAEPQPSARPASAQRSPRRTRSPRLSRRSSTVVSAIAAISGGAPQSGTPAAQAPRNEDAGEPNSIPAAVEAVQRDMHLEPAAAKRLVTELKDDGLITASGQISVVGRMVSLAAHGESSAVTELEMLLRGTRDQLNEGRSLAEIAAGGAEAGGPGGSAARDIRPEARGARAELPRPAAEIHEVDLAKPPADQSLEDLLRGTKGKLDEGAPLGQIGRESPARASYVADKAELRARQAEEFRARAREAERAAQDHSPIGISDLTPPPPAGDLEALLRGTQQQLDHGVPFGRIGREPAVAEAAHPYDIHQLEIAHEGALERAAEAADPAERQAALHEAAAIERQITQVGARPGVVEDVAAMAKVTTRVEHAVAKLTDLLGDEAPLAARQAAEELRAAEATSDRKYMARMTRAVDDNAEDIYTPRGGRRPRQVGVDRRPLMTSDAVIGEAKAAKLRADADLARARAAETEARGGARAARDAAKEARATAAKGAPIVATASGPPRRGLGTAILDAAKVVAVAGELGVPGIPHPHDIPVIGPLLSAYVKYRALKAATGRFIGRVPATAEARAAALAARTKDKIAKAVDMSLDLVERAAPKSRAALITTAVRLSDALKPRAFDDGQPDAPKDSTLTERAAVRMREVAFAAAHPEAVIQQVRREMIGVSDPDLLDAIERHQVALYQHLNDTAPKGPPPSPYDKQEWQPSPAAAMQWARRYDVATRPESVFEAMMRQELTPEAADTFRVGYPRLFAMAQQRLIDRAADLQRPVPYRQLMQNALLFNVDLHPSLDPQNAAVLATAHAKSASAAPAPGAPPGAPPTPSIAAPTSVDNLYQPAESRRALMR